MVKNEDRAKICKYSEDGFWLEKKNRKYFISFAEYPPLSKLDLPQLTFFTELKDGILCWEALKLTLKLPL